MKPKIVGAMEIPSYLGHHCIRIYTNAKSPSVDNSMFLQPDFRNVNKNPHQGCETFAKDLPMPPLG